MKNLLPSSFRKYLGALLSVAFITPMASAALTDEEGMPIVYLRGTFGEWQPAPEYKFTRTGNIYSLEITESNPVTPGKFKIADEDWNFDFGANGDLTVDQFTVANLRARGSNILTSGFSEGTIYFEYPGKDSEFLNVTFDLPAPSIDDKLSGSLPVLYINVYTDETHKFFENEIIDYHLSHKNYFTEAEYWLDTNGCPWIEEAGIESVGSEESPLPLQIKARGNYTRIGFSKKPFKIKLDKKQNLLGLTPDKSKHYALLAHADDDNGYMRNFLAFNLGERIGLPWTPASQPIELVINGDYRGLYFLTESIRVGDGRIEIEELEDKATEPELISGGYVVELDNYDEENQIQMQEKSWVHGHYLDTVRITYDTPEEYSDIQKRFVTDQFSSINDLVGTNSDELWSYLDLDDAARYYLVNEIVGDTESYHGSTYLYRDRGEDQKWHFSPLWDAGNALQARSKTFFYDCDPFGNTWIPSMRQNATFNDKVEETWLWFMQREYPGIEEDLDEFAEHVTLAAKADRKRWAGEPHPGGGRDVADNTDMARKVTEVKDYLSSRVAWLATVFGNFNNGNFTEPARDTTPAAELPEYAQAGVSEIFETVSGLENVEYYNMQGMKVSHPKSGELYIIKQGNRSFKAILK